MKILKKVLDFRNYNIRSKLLSVISVFMLLGLISGAFLFFSLKNIQLANKNKNLILEITKHAQDIIHNEKEYINNPGSYNLTKYTESINEITVDFDDLKKYYSEKDEIDFILNLIKDNMNTFFSIAENYEESKNKPEYSEKVLLMIQNDAKNTLAERDKEFFANLLKFNRKFNESIDNYLSSTYNEIYLLFGTSFVFFFIITIFIMWEINISIIVPIRQLAGSMIRFGEGDFDSKSEVSVKNEIGALSETFNNMVKSVIENLQMKKFISNSTLTMIKNDISDDQTSQTAKKNVAILFSDMRGFTSMSEQMKPAEVIEILNQYLNFQTGIIKKHNGDIDKFVGDEIVAIFHGENQEEDAVQSAIDIQKGIQNINESRTRAGQKISKFGIGINCGEIIFGSIGSDDRKDYTVIGDNVNLASRLCDSAPPDTIIISEPVKSIISSVFKGQIEELEPITVKGKQHPIKIYKVQF